MEISEVTNLYLQIMLAAIPFTLVFYIGDFLVTTFLRVAFGGKLTFKSF